jgi:hypothetical protein
LTLRKNRWILSLADFARFSAATLAIDWMNIGHDGGRRASTLDNGTLPGFIEINIVEPGELSMLRAIHRLALLPRGRNHAALNLFALQCARKRYPDVSR